MIVLEIIETYMIICLHLKRNKIIYVGIVFEDSLLVLVKLKLGFFLVIIVGNIKHNYLLNLIAKYTWFLEKIDT